MTDTINVGSSANDHTGDLLRTAFVKANAKFSQLQAAFAYRGSWASGTSYALRDYFVYLGQYYVVTQDHVASVFADDLAAELFGGSDLVSLIALLNSYTGASQIGTLDSRTVQARIDALPAEVGAFVTAEADRAENAADAALIGAGVYVDEPTGRAAVANGVAFKVQGSGDVAAYEYRRVSAGSSTLIATYPSATAVAANTFALADIQPLFDYVAPKNLYDPDLAIDGQVYSFTTGALGAFADTISSGLVPVTVGQTYTFSQPTAERGFLGNVYAFDASGVYLGMAALQTTNAVVAGMGLVISDLHASGGYRRVTFTVPAGVAFVGMTLLYGYLAHTTPDFDRIRAAVQLELGGVPTAFVVYTPQNTTNVKDMPPLLDAFEVTPAKNLYNLALASDGFIRNYSNGAQAVYAPGIDLGQIPVEPDTTYTVSMGDGLGFNSSIPIYCWSAAGTFLGIDHTIGATTGMASPPTSVIWSGLSSCTFTIPPGSLIAYVSFLAAYAVGHTAADFERVIGSVQLEVGATATEWQRYAPYGYAALKELAGTSLPGLANSIDALGASTRLPALSVSKTGNDLYIVAGWDATKNLVQKVTLATGIAFTNDTVNVQGARTALKTATSNSAAWAGGTVLASQGDSTAPLHYNGTYIGGNHGANIVKEVTATAHGKTVEDVGSEWTDGAAVKWYLMRVVDANKLWFVSANLSVYPLWSFTSTITGNLTHSASAMHAGAVTVGSYTTTQLYPALQNQTKTVLLDGVTEITAAGTYRCRRLDIINTYNICNPAAVVTYVRSLVGGATQPDFVHSSIAADVRRTLTYQYAENGSCNIVDGIRTLNALPTLGYLGATQAEALTHSGKQLWQYIPRVTSKTNGSGTWAFANQAQIDGTFEQINLTSANWTDANNPPDRMAQIVKTAGVAEFGMMIGYSPVRSVGLPALRKTLMTDACFVSAARKQYVKAVEGGSLAANAYFEIVAFRAFWPASAASAATCFTWYRDGKKIIVVADFHQTVTLSPLVLPAEFNGMDVTVVDKTASATLHGNGVVTPDGLLVSTAGGYGYFVLQLS